MELGLSLGEAAPPKPFPFAVEKGGGLGLGLGFCMGLGRTPGPDTAREREEERDFRECASMMASSSSMRSRCSPGSPPVQLELLPFSPVPRWSSGGLAALSPGPPPPQLGFHWSPEQGNSEGWNRGVPCGLDVNRPPSSDGADGVGAPQPVTSSPNSAASSFQVDYRLGGGAGGSSDGGGPDRCDADRAASSRNSDEDDNGLARKKLRLSKEQSAFLEESFKEHNTLNPKQKLALAKQLNLRPRQVEVWFQNRRARTKLKQTEVDCEYLKRCCEKLTEENRRLQKELQELRQLKSSPHPYYMHLPATTLTMCPSCERVATTTTAPPASTNNNNAPVKDSQPPSGFPIRPKSVYPFGPQQPQTQNQQQNIAAAPATSAPHQQPSPAAAAT